MSNRYFTWLSKLPVHLANASADRAVAMLKKVEALANDSLKIIIGNGNM